MDINQIKENVKNVRNEFNDIKFEPVSDDNWNKYCDLVNRLNDIVDNIASLSFNKEEKIIIIGLLKGPVQAFINDAHEYEKNRREFLAGLYDLEIMQNNVVQDFGSWLEQGQPAVEQPVQPAPQEQVEQAIQQEQPVQEQPVPQQQVPQEQPTTYEQPVQEETQEKSLENVKKLTLTPQATHPTV